MEKIRTRLYVVGLLVLGTISVGLISRGSFGQTPVASESSEVGRYQIVKVGSETNPDLYLLDSKTGRCWVRRSLGEPWTEDSPSTQNK